MSILIYIPFVQFPFGAARRKREAEEEYARNRQQQIKRLEAEKTDLFDIACRERTGHAQALKTVAEAEARAAQAEEDMARMQRAFALWTREPRPIRLMPKSQSLSVNVPVLMEPPSVFIAPTGDPGPGTMSSVTVPYKEFTCRVKIGLPPGQPPEPVYHSIVEQLSRGIGEAFLKANRDSSGVFI